VIRNLVATCLASAGLVLLSTAAQAAGDDHGGPTMADLIWQGVNLVLLLAVLVFLARKPIQAFFAGRREQIQSDLDEAGRLLEQAEARAAEWQTKLTALDDDLAEIRRTSQERAELERQQILEDAQRAGERIRRDATAVVDQELRRAQEELRREASDLAVEVAASLLREHVGENDRDRLMDEFISRVEHADNGARR